MKFIDVSIKADFGNLRARTARQQRDLKRLPKEFHQEVVDNTPIDRGHARNNTILRGTTVRSNYAYAKRLNEGWSKQAPQGFVQPALEWLRQRIQQIFGRKTK
jgi:hypothetical protein